METSFKLRILNSKLMHLRVILVLLVKLFTFGWSDKSNILFLLHTKHGVTCWRCSIDDGGHYARLNAWQIKNKSIVVIIGTCCDFVDFLLLLSFQDRSF